MDNITHGALGIAIGMLRRRDGGPENDAPVSHTDKAVVWASFLAAEAPDIDIFFGSAPMDEYVYHRGLTHAVVFAPVWALVAALITKLIWREARAATVFGWSLVSVLVAHMLNDWMTGWGTRVLLPFSEARLGLDWIPIVDYLYLPPLLFAVIMAARKPHLRRKVIVGVLTYLMIYAVGYRGLTHTLVERAVTATYAGQPARQIRVSPDMFNPLVWNFTVDMPDRFEQGKAYPFGAVKATNVTAKPQEDEVIRAVRQAPELKPFFEQFAYVLVRYTQVAGGYDVTMGDVRYGLPGRGAMEVRVRLDESLKVSEIEEGGW